MNGIFKITGLLLAILLSSHAMGEDPFNFDTLKEKAQALAEKEYLPPRQMPANLAALDYDQYRKILFNTPAEVWKKLPFALQFMHPGYFYHTGVTIHQLDNGVIQDIPFSKKYYLYTGNLPADAVDENALDFAGFRLLHERKPGDYAEVISFLGASYFRAVGEGQNFGLSARGLALNTIPPGTEEFPAFREFWITRPTQKTRVAKIFALLDSQSVSGAYEFTVTPGKETLVHVKATLFARKRLDALGIAPLTSMFWYGGINSTQPLSKGRPAVHDSDGLLIEGGDGAWTWHPLSNPTKTKPLYFQEENVRGFGLVQRDRDPADFLDKEARYETRPTAWIEPVGDWGKGTVRLLELHTGDEYMDNVVTLWTPAAPLEQGKSLSFEYNIHWSADAGKSTSLLHVESTRIITQKETNTVRFTVNFSPGKTVSINTNDMMVHLQTPSGMQVTTPTLKKTKKGWDVTFDAGIPSQPEEITCVLQNQSKNISEIWHYQLQP